MPEYAGGFAKNKIGCAFCIAILVILPAASCCSIQCILVAG